MAALLAAFALMSTILGTVAAPASADVSDVVQSVAGTIASIGKQNPAPAQGHTATP
ncbi:hypothetical protein [Nonomuraea sp. NPDC005650]|uniref:hypothetical protein n=1 Tax=Nonomuraea sp. NPDC005650 TaxID=3157045 RepID=UPI0033B98CDA